MSISAISSLIAVSGGKATLPSVGEVPAENGLPPGFAALLAEQIPSPDQTIPGLLTAESIPASQQPASELLSKVIEGSAKEVLAALSANPSQSVATAAESDRKKEDGDKERKLAADSIQTDPGLAAQYVVPMATPPVQNRPPESVDRNKPDTAPHMAKADGIDFSNNEGRPPLSEQRGSHLTGAIAAPNPELPTPPRSDSANAAILAGDSNPGNSGSTSAFATAMAAAGATNSTAAPTPPPAIASAIHSPNWTQDFGSRVVWLAKNDQQVAQININPPQLGPIQITLSINGDQTSAAFASPHQEVRQAIQDSLPELREMFSNAGISLGEAHIGSQLSSQNREIPFQFGNEARTSGENAILSPDSHASSNLAGIPIQRGRGLVDLFA